MFGVGRRLDVVENHIEICNGRNEARIDKDNEMMLMMSKLSEGLSNHGKREEELEKGTQDELKATNKTLTTMLGEITSMKEASLIQHEKNQADNYSNTNKIMTHIRDKFESTQKADDREKSLKMQMNYMWAGLCLCVSSVIATAILFGWLYANVISPQTKAPAKVDLISSR